MKLIDMTAKTAVVAAIRSLGTGQGRAPELARTALQNNYWDTASENPIHNLRSAMLGRPDIFNKLQPGVFELTPAGLELLAAAGDLYAKEPKSKPRLVVDNTVHDKAVAGTPAGVFDAEAVTDAAMPYLQDIRPETAEYVAVDGLVVLVLDGEEIALDLVAGDEEDMDEINETMQGFLDSEQVRNEAGYEDASALPMSVLDELAA